MSYLDQDTFIKMDEFTVDMISMWDIVGATAWYCADRTIHDPTATDNRLVFQGYDDALSTLWE